MSELQTRPAPHPVISEPLVLSNQERELVRLLRVIHFWRTGHGRRLLFDWNGVRLAVFDIQQMQ